MLARRLRSPREVLATTLLWAVVLTSLHSLVPPMFVSAQAPTDAQRQADDARARELYAIGDDFYAIGRYEAAEEAFAEAYRLSGRPLLLFNLANAQERSGRLPEAVENLRRYREYASESEHPTLDPRITALQRRIDERAAESRDEPVVVIQHESAELPAAPMEQRRRAREPIPPHLVLLPVSGALSLITVGLALRTRTIRDEVRSACVRSGGPRFCSPEAESAIVRDRRFSLATDALAVATLATAAFGVWALVHHRRRTEEGPRLQIGATRGRFELGLAGAF